MGGSRGRRPSPCRRTPVLAAIVDGGVRRVGRGRCHLASPRSGALASLELRARGRGADGPSRPAAKAPGIVHRGLLLPVDVTRVDGIPVTTPARTLIDVAAVCDEEAVEEALDDALRRGIVSIPRLRWRLAELGRRPGVVMMRRLLDARAGSSVPQSVFETRLLRLLRPAGLPAPAVQYAIRLRERRVAVADFAYPPERLAIEADGYRWHSGRADWERDRSRLNDLTLLGWRVIHVTWTELSGRPQAVIAALQDALAAGPAENRAEPP